jgi:signal transduction histidine kinase
VSSTDASGGQQVEADALAGAPTSISRLRIGRRGAPPASTRRVIVIAVIRSAVVFLVLAAVSILVLDRAATSEAKSEAGRSAEVTARVALAPYLTDDLLGQEPASVAALDAAARTLMSYQKIHRLKIWSADGVVLWSDDPRVIGLQFELEPEEAALLETQGDEISISDLSKEENAFEASEGRLLEVYFGSRTPSGQPVLVETYYSYSSVQDLVDEYRRRFFPLFLLGLFALALLQVPLALALVRRMAAGRRERDRLLHRAIGISDSERRRIAAEVHDGAVQDLIGVGFALAGRAETAPAPLGAELAELSQATMATVRTLRGLLASIYPVAVPEGGWVAGIDDLLDELRARDVDVTIDDVGERPPHLEELLVLRTAREALRNVISHANAGHVAVRLSRHGTAWTLEIIDDGQGFVLADAEQRVAQGHLGMALLRDLATDAGARMIIHSTPGHGTVVRLELEAAT